MGGCEFCLTHPSLKNPTQDIPLPTPYPRAACRPYPHAFTLTFFLSCPPPHLGPPWTSIHARSRDACRARLRPSSLPSDVTRGRPSARPTVAVRARPRAGPHRRQHLLLRDGVRVRAQAHPAVPAGQPGGGAPIHRPVGAAPRAEARPAHRARHPAHLAARPARRLPRRQELR